MPENANKKLIETLLKLPAETDWCEFKENNDSPEMIAETICAVGNSACLESKEFGFVVWGIKDVGHGVAGTRFDPDTAKKGNETLVSWLSHTVSPDPEVRFETVQHGEKRLVLAKIRAAMGSPYRFREQSFIRVGATNRKLRDHPDREKRLWRALDSASFEKQIAATDLSESEVRERLDVSAYYRFLGQSEPDATAGLDALIADRLIVESQSGLYAIANLGAIALARNFRFFPELGRKTVRLVIYQGIDRTRTLREISGERGYALAFDRLIAYLVRILPKNEEIKRAFRTERPIIPSLAFREVIANALIHQDFRVRGAGPLIEIFDDRVEISNPGVPLHDVARLLDLPPRSRNEELASLMRRFGICEERGTGIDKVLTQVELYQLPPPDFRVSGDNTCVTLFGPRPFREMGPDERVRACYQHASLMFVSNKRMTNASLRKRFAISPNNAAQVSRIIRDALKSGRIKVADRQAPKSGYIPAWAAI